MIQFTSGRRKILILTPDLKGMGGVSNYFNTLQLNELDYIDYFIINSAKPESRWETLKRLVKNYGIFFKLIKSHSYHLIHINPSFDKRSFFRDALFIWLAQLYSINLLIFFRGWNNSFEEKVRKTAFHKFIFRNTYGKCKNFIVLSLLFENKLKGLGIKENRAHFWLETTVADSSYLKGFSLERKIDSLETGINILFLSRIIKNKGIFIAIDAFTQLMQQCPAYLINLIIAGDGKDLPEVEAYVKRNKIPNIIFSGHVEKKKKGEILLKSHILLFPTFHGEGLPNTVLEAMMYGMPVISRPNAGISDVVIHEVNGYLTESGTPAIFTDLLKLLIMNKEKLVEMAAINHDIALKKFSKERVKQRLLDIYQQVMVS